MEGTNKCLFSVDDFKILTMVLFGWGDASLGRYVEDKSETQHKKYKVPHTDNHFSLRNIDQNSLHSRKTKKTSRVFQTPVEAYNLTN